MDEQHLAGRVVMSRQDESFYETNETDEGKMDEGKTDEDITDEGKTDFESI